MSRDNQRMPRITPLPEEFTCGPFAYEYAVALGVGPGRLRGRDLSRPFRGVCSAGPVTSGAVALAIAYATRMPSDHCFSHLTAAALHGMRLPEHAQRDRRIHVSAPSGSRSPRPRGVVGHELDSTPVTLASGLRVTSPSDTWCQLASTLSLDDLIVMGDGLVRRLAPLASMQRLADAVAGYAGRRGVRRLRVAFEQVRPRTDSARETMVRLLIVRAGLPEPKINVTILNRYGAKIATGDMGYPDYRVLLEYDGGDHRENEEQYNWDIDRLDEIMEEHWRVLRINKSHLRAPVQLLARIRTALVQAGWRP